MVIYIEIVNRLLCPCREGWLSFEKFFQTASADYQVIAKPAREARQRSTIVKQIWKPVDARDFGCDVRVFALTYVRL